MASLPYVTSPGNIERALAAIKSASVPEKVSQDFVKTILKIPGGSGDQITTYLKKVGFAGSDGAPTELYKKFRNPTTSGQSVAEAVRKAYAPLFIRNEYMFNLNDDELLGLIVEETGQPHDSNIVKLSFQCLKAMLAHANFNVVKPNSDQYAETDRIQSYKGTLDEFSGGNVPAPSSGIGLNLGYTINLNLPATTDPAVFNAIFKSLKEHLLSDKDG